MTSDNPISEIYNKAIEITDSDKREEYLNLACKGNQDLLNEIKSLIKFTDIADIMEQFREDDPSLIGQYVGKYKVKSEIGRGGMGAVYLGERTETFQHFGAIKIIKRGLLNEEGAKRFSKEIRMLAKLDHPNISHLIDGGLTEDNLPYFVMEFIDGQKIDQYCDSNRLSIKQRLELFIKVCEVVQYAHEKGVIHRDLKPGNILVTKGGIPKLIDFGIAKVLDPALATSLTIDLATQIKCAFSPDYASPEQFNGIQNIDKTTDVYSLGAVLYLLLSGHSAHKFKSDDLNEFRRVICEAEPLKPSKIIYKTDGASAEDTNSSPIPKLTIDSISDARDCQPKQLHRELAGDLDCIVTKALRKEPHRRYKDVAAFANDIKNYLEGKPVNARSGSRWYRFDKYVNRFFSSLPPFSMNWIPKLAVYAAVVLVFLLLWNYRAVKSTAVTGYYLVDSQFDNSGKIPISAGQTKELEKSITILTNHLSSKVAPLAADADKWTWTMADLVVSLKGRAEIDKSIAEKFFAETLKQECHCWADKSQAEPHRNASAWVLIAMSRLDKLAGSEQIKWFLENQHTDGWWALRASPTDKKNASTYTTAISILALHEQLRLGLDQPEQELKVRDAIKRGQQWLIERHKDIGRARWWDYPFHPEQKESVGLSGLILHVLHQTGANSTQIHDIDNQWLENLPVIGTHAPKDSVVTGVEISGGDGSTNYSIPWALIGTVDAYHSGTVLQKANARIWMDDYIFSNLDKITQSATPDTDWVAAELQLALRYLQGEKAI